MNGVHDMGGMTCFGAIEREEDEPVFHAAWERRVFGLLNSWMGQIDTLDAVRHSLERMDPIHYLSSTYYEHWLAGLETLAVEHGIVLAEELATGVAEATGEPASTPAPPEQAEAVVRGGAPFERSTGRLTPRFAVGDLVMARNIHPFGHTRLPRYARGKRGVIARVHGTFVYPDTNAHGEGEQPQPLYSVRFAARGLWGPGTAAADYLFLDLWEDYLEPASGTEEGP